MKVITVLQFYFNGSFLCKIWLKAGATMIRNYWSQTVLDFTSYLLRSKVMLSSWSHFRLFIICWEWNIRSSAKNDLIQHATGIFKHAEAKESPNRCRRWWPDDSSPDSVLLLEANEVQYDNSMQTENATLFSVRLFCKVLFILLIH